MSVTDRLRRTRSGLIEAAREVAPFLALAAFGSLSFCAGWLAFG